MVLLGGLEPKVLEESEITSTGHLARQDNPGPNGLDGINGNVGDRGPKGPPGEKGADAKFCPCPMELQIISQQNKKSLAQTARPTVAKPIAKPSPPPKPQPKERSSEDDDVLEIAHPVISAAIHLHESPASMELGRPASPTTSLRAAPPAHADVGPPGERSHGVNGRAPGTIIGTRKLPEVNTMKTPSPSKPNINDDNAIHDHTYQEDNDIRAKQQEERVDLPSQFGSRSPSNQVSLSELVRFDDDYEETTTMPTTTRRRFVYVTKKPRHYFI
ncbi:hypothetical protein OSTOST_12566 [Ostertagia ostertagi]